MKIKPFLECVTDEDFRLSMLAEQEPWKLEGKTIYEWIAARPALTPDSIDAHPYRFIATQPPPPNSSGVYIILDRQGELAYIGKATSIIHRLVAHWNDRRIPMGFAGWLLCPVKAAEVLEAYLIGEDEPPYNRKFDPGMALWHRELSLAIERRRATSLQE